MVLPAGFSLPPLPHLVALLVGIVAVGWLLARARPPVTERLVIAAVPWVLVGSALHVVYQIGVAPPAVEPFLGAPAVYLTTFVLAGAALAAADATLADPGRALAGAGTVAFVAVVTALVVAAPRLRPAWSLVGLVGGGVLAGAVWVALRRLRPGIAATVPRVGVLVVFSHALDGVSTAIGVDVLDFGERTPASRAILKFAAALPTADVLGTGWLFVLVKVAVAAAVVWLFVDYVREEPAQGYLLLGVIAAVGLGPGAHNLLLYAVAA